MQLGGVNEVVQEMYLNLMLHPPTDDMKLSTAVYNQAKWTLYGLENRKRTIEIDNSTGVPDLPAESESDELERLELREAILGLLNTLTYRERSIIQLRFGLMDGWEYSLEDTGRILKVTRERVRQIESKAIKKLQHKTRADRLINHFI